MDDKILKNIQSARQTQSTASVELWNVRLGLLRSVGDYQALLHHLASPAELAGNNCECNNGCNVPCGSNCGALERGFGSVTQPA